MKKLFVLDTNVLMYDPHSLFKFKQHDICIPITVLEELDNHKTGMSDLARNVRQVTRTLSSLLANCKDIVKGAPLGESLGRIYFAQEREFFDIADNIIIKTAEDLTKANLKRKVILVSRDINLRVKATIKGLTVEDYQNDRVEDESLVYEDHVPKGPIANLSSAKNNIWGIIPKNIKQNIALNMLLNPEIDLVILQGQAGTGKTLLTLAAGLYQTLDKHVYEEIIVTRATIPLGDDIGFLPGNEEEKMTPWMGALIDNLEVLHSNQTGGKFGKEATNDLIKHRIKIRSLNFMRGRTFINRYIIIDEAQNLTSKQIKTLVTRAGPGSKIVCLGDLKQIDTPYLTEYTSGLSFIIDKFKNWEHSANINLVVGVRSRLSKYAANNL